ncbi:MAG: hypothetical protein CO064_02570 [Anaerolineae bacterium CG_4_9_14_0_8_um_filter_58_9]|nr:MAG: hypothetical protein CO064_02570 [Anaerolineae bacterium CG_4_9_14_0_8_um_filter_58_9]
METTSFTALVRAMRQAQQTYFKDRNRASLIAAKEAERAVDTALVVLPDNRPGIHVGCWYGDEGDQAARPAAIIGLPPTQDGEPVEAVLEVYEDFLNEIAPSDDALHEFILKWERYALDHYLPFDVSEDFNVVEDRWQVAVEE